jgi:hypothetical protein
LSRDIHIIWHNFANYKSIYLQVTKEKWKHFDNPSKKGTTVATIEKPGVKLNEST